MPAIRQLISYLRANGNTGRNNPITALELAQHFDVSDGGTEVPIRDVIRGAIEQGRLIGSCNRGFYLITTLDDLEFNLDDLRSRAEGILQRRRNLLSNWNTPRRTRDRTILTDLTIR
jgi:hypothetical protein